MPSYILVHNLGALRPRHDDERARDMMRRFGENQLVKINGITIPRNIKLHNKFFAMLGIILQNQEHYKSMDDLLDVCKLSIGHVRVISTGRGCERVPKSISFASMDDIEFDAFYNRAVDWMLAEVIPGLQRQHLDAEVEAKLLEFAG